MVGRSPKAIKRGPDAPLISFRSQLLISQGMCSIVGSPTAVTREIRSLHGSNPGASCICLGMCFMVRSPTAVTRGIRSPSGSHKESTPYLSGICVILRSPTAVIRGISCPSGFHQKAADHLPGYMLFGRYSNSCHNGNQKPQWVSLRSQLLCKGMCFTVWQDR